MPPVYPNYPMCLGFVVKVDSTNGVVFLAQQNHSIKTFRVQMDQHIGGNLTIDGNLNVVGTTSTTSTSDVTAYAPFIVLMKVTLLVRYILRSQVLALTMLSSQVTLLYNLHYLLRQD